MHSVRRVKTSAEQRLARKKAEATQISAHQTSLSLILQRDHSDPLKALARTTDLLAYYPEQYTAWNIRREILTILESHEKYGSLLAQELKFTQSLLPTHPKVYWIWNHRRWVLDRLPPSQAYQSELLLTTKLLERDARNFHGWNYRWHVLNRLLSSISDVAEVEQVLGNELQFTTTKINENFSNRSAWHYRAQIIPQLRSQRPALASELSYVSNAVGMDPTDQSGWLYLQWLLESPLFAAERTPEVLAEPAELIAELLEDEPTIFAARALRIVDQQLGKPTAEIERRMLALDKRASLSASYV